MTMNDFYQALAQADQIETCFERLCALLKTRGIHTISFTNYAYHPNSANPLKYDICTPNFKSWHEHYLEEAYNDFDSVLPEVYHCRLPIYWNAKAQLAQAKTEKEKQMRQDAIDYGADCGLSIPLHGPRYDFAILLLVQMQGETGLSDWENQQFEFQQMGQLYFQAIQKHLKQAQLDIENPLSERELECLHALAEQAPLSQIAELMAITERTVNFHIQNINKKLGTKNKHQSVTRALEAGWLTL